MSRAPLLRSSPAGSSYGALQDSDEDTRDPLQPQHTHRTRSQRASFENEGSPSTPQAFGPRRSLSFGRRRNSMYAGRHKRRPSSATSDVGMGADSKYSFATGLAVPGNPVMQETPMSSPYMSDDDILGIDDDDPKSFDEDPPDNSPYAQVRASVPATDDVSLSINSRFCVHLVFHVNTLSNGAQHLACGFCHCCLL